MSYTCNLLKYTLNLLVRISKLVKLKFIRADKLSVIYPTLLFTIYIYSCVCLQLKLELSFTEYNSCIFKYTKYMFKDKCVLLAIIRNY